MALTEEQKRKILNNPNFKALSGQVEQPPQITTDIRSAIAERRRAKETEPIIEPVVEPTMEEEKPRQSFAEQSIGGFTEEEVKQQAEEAQSMAREIVTGGGKLLARPFVEFIRGFRQLIPGGKTGEEPIKVPGLGEIEPLTPKKAAIEAGETALTFLPVERLLSPIINKFKGVKTVDEMVDNLVGKITQGKPKDIEVIKKSINQLDTSKIKTYKELTESADESIKALSKAQDRILEGVPTIKKIDEFTDVIADREVNIIRESVDQLSEFYEKTGDLNSLQLIKDLETKFNTVGVNAQDINDLARRFSSDMPSAFSKTGEPLTSVNKVKMENTRKELKETAREFLPNDASRQLDTQMTGLFRLSELSTKMEDKVQLMYNKVQDKGLLQKLSEKLSDVVNVATFKTLEGFMSSFIKKSDNLTSAEIQEQLSKNLNKLDDLLNMSISDEKLLSEVEQLIIQNIGKEPVKKLIED